MNTDKQNHLNYIKTKVPCVFFVPNPVEQGPSTSSDISVKLGVPLKGV
jgi:hypothetical protein